MGILKLKKKGKWLYKLQNEAGRINGIGRTRNVVITNLCDRASIERISMIYLAIGLLLIVFLAIGILATFFLIIDFLTRIGISINECEFCGGSLKYWGTTGRGRVWICNACGKKQDGME